MSGRSNHAEPPRVLDALDKSKQATETIQQAADDLAVVNTVLDTHVPPEGRNEELIRRSLMQINCRSNLTIPSTSCRTSPRR